MMKKHLFMREDTVLARVCLIKYLLPAPLEVQQIDVLENPMCFPTLDLKTKLISSENTFRSLCGMVVYKILMSKVEIDLALFLKLIFFQFSDNWKIFLHKPEFLTGRTKKRSFFFKICLNVNTKTNVSENFYDSFSTIINLLANKDS